MDSPKIIDKIKSFNIFGNKPTEECLDKCIVFNNFTKEFDGKRIRVTPNYKLCVNDFIIVYCQVEKAHGKITKIKKNYPELVNFTDKYQFLGKGQVYIHVASIEQIINFINNYPMKYYASDFKQNVIEYIRTHLNLIKKNEESNNAQIIEYNHDNIIFDNSLPEFSGHKIRITPDKKVSVFDTIKVFCNAYESKKVWYDLIDKYPELNNLIITFKFNGQGQKETPVMDSNGLIELIMLLPGKHAADMRKKFAETIIRYLGGDLSLIDEIKENNKIQDSLDKNDPRKLTLANTDKAILQIDTFCKENNIDDVFIQSCNGKTGCYILFIGIHKNQFILKFGNTGTSANGRLDAHYSKFNNINDPDFEPGIRVVYFKETLHYASVEKEFKRQLKCLNMYLGKYKIGNITSIELFTLTKEFSINEIINIMDKIINSNIKSNDKKLLPTIANIDIDFEKYKLDHEYRMIQIDNEYNIKSKELDIKLAYEQEKTKQLELQIELLKLQKYM
jgi:hypothetical protein